MDNKLTLYKLIVLYLLNAVDFTMTTSQISEFVLAHGYTTFFKLQEALNELVSSNHLNTEITHNRTLYYLTKDGVLILNALKDQISPAIIKDIHIFLMEKQYDLKEEAGVKANYYPTEEEEFIVRCQIVDNGLSIIDLKLAVPTENEAKIIANNWMKSNQELYSQILSRLL